MWNNCKIRKLVTWWEKNGQFGKVIAGKLNHLEGNFDFCDKDIHKKKWEI